MGLPHMQRFRRLFFPLTIRLLTIGLLLSLPFSAAQANVLISNTVLGSSTTPQVGHWSQHLRAIFKSMSMSEMTIANFSIKEAITTL
jgi:hypothetical protein